MSAPVERRLLAARPSEVYYFGTCVLDLFDPDAGLAGMDLLRREGLRVVFPQAQSCCGQPAFNSGHPDDARTVARAQIKAFARDIPVVVPSGSCAGMMRTHYPDLFAGDPMEAEARAFAARVWELTEFLVHVLTVDLRDSGPPVRVTWHSSCHAMREMGVRDEPLHLLAQLANVTVVDLPRAWECCGFGGTFAVKVPEVSAAMAADKAAAVESTGADMLLSGDNGCLMNIGGTLDKRGSPIAVRHIASFLWERTQ